MKKTATMLLVAACVLGLASLASAQHCGWEDGTSTVLGSYGNLASATNVTSMANTGAHSVELIESPVSGTPQAFVAFIEGLTDGDAVTAGFYGYDITPSASPSMRVWGHYGESGDIGSYNGSAGGNSTYTDGSGWSMVDHTWTFDSSGGTRDALIVECRLYSTATAFTYYADDVSVWTSAGTVTLACGGSVSVESASWGVVKSEYR
ncbi:MAG: hypothetical protein QGI43_01175 [Gemmatimonadota bacterium]|nr:hypothetical protein [Gemmatimonadota bacterium]